MELTRNEAALFFLGLHQAIVFDYVVQERMTFRQMVEFLPKVQSEIFYLLNDSLRNSGYEELSKQEFIEMIQDCEILSGTVLRNEMVPR